MSSFSPAAPGAGTGTVKAFGNASLLGASVLAAWRARVGQDEKSSILRGSDNGELFLPGAFSALDAGGVAGYMKNNTLQARSSGGEHYLDTVGVPGSNPGVPTRYFKGLRFIDRDPFFFCGTIWRPSWPTTAGSRRQTSCLGSEMRVKGGVGLYRDHDYPLPPGSS